MQKLRLESLRLITFDVTDTLLKFKTPPWQYYVLIAKDYGFFGSEDEVKSKLKANINEMSKKHPNYGKNSISYVNWWSQVVKNTLKDNLPISTNLDNIAVKLINGYKTSECWSLLDGTYELLDLIKNQNIPIGVISNSDPRLIDVLKNFDLYDKFDFVLTSYEAGYSKPDQMIFESAIKMSKMNVKPSEALHIGDDLEKDYRGAKNAGWNAILVNPDMKADMPADVQCVFSNLKGLSHSIKFNNISL